MREYLDKDPFGFRPLWDAILSIYKEFAKICQKHNLRYYLAYGNVLGAVRHCGFIPWDDDFDVMMPRADYERFLHIAPKELPEFFKLVTWRNTPEFSANLFAKIMDCYKERLDDVENKTGRCLNQGLFIDIFPLDGIPQGRISLDVLKLKKFFLDVVAYPLSKSFRDCRKFKQICVWLVGRLIGIVSGIRKRENVNCLLEKIITVEPFDRAQRCGCIVSPYGFLRDICDADVYGIPKLLKYEDLMIPCPANSDKYLKTIYGDYMKLPPKENRRPSHVIQEEAPWRLGPTMCNV